LELGVKINFKKRHPRLLIQREDYLRKPSHWDCLDGRKPDAATRTQTAVPTFRSDEAKEGAQLREKNQNCSKRDPTGRKDLRVNSVRNHGLKGAREGTDRITVALGSKETVKNLAQRKSRRFSKMFSTFMQGKRS